MRLVEGTWWNFNSLFPAPQPLSSFYLSAFLDTLRDQGYTIFVVSGAGGGYAAVGAAEHCQTYTFHDLPLHVVSLCRVNPWRCPQPRPWGGLRCWGAWSVPKNGQCCGLELVAAVCLSPGQPARVGVHVQWRLG
jgi:hypothetical protein